MIFTGYVDITEQRALAAQFHIKIKPQLIFFQKSHNFKPIHYKGAKSSEQILNWVSLRFNFKLQKLQT